MDIDVFAARDRETVFRVLRTALRHDGALARHERLFLDTFARIIGGPRCATDPDRIGAEGVHVEGAHSRKRLIQLAAMAALLSRPVRPDAIAFLKALARHLHVRDSVIDIMEALHRGDLVKVRMLAMRRGSRAMVKEAYLSEGLAGPLRYFGALLFKAPVNKDKLWHYKRLGLLPEGTLGREYWKHMTAAKFNFPGEPAGIPDSVAYHDVGHVLAGHDVTPLGEIQQGSFQGGNRREDGFIFVVFVILHFHHGVRITPNAPPETGNFDPEKVLWAVHRGARCNVDLTHQWDFWPLMPLTLQESCAKCGLLPNLPERANDADAVVPASPLRTTPERANGTGRGAPAGTGARPVTSGRIGARLPCAAKPDVVMAGLRSS